jgi:hypothetical protein
VTMGEGGTGRASARATSRSSSARKLVGPHVRKAYATPSSITRFAIVPTLASLHALTIAICETTTAAAPIIQSPRGHVKSATAVASESAAASAQTAPIGLEIGCASCGSSASPNAFAVPIRWMSPWTTTTDAKTQRTRRSPPAARAARYAAARGRQASAPVEAHPASARRARTTAASHVITARTRLGTLRPCGCTSCTGIGADG